MWISIDCCVHNIVSSWRHWLRTIRNQVCLISLICYSSAIVFFCRGQTPAESDFQILEIARKLDMYGVRFHPAADREGTKINLSVSHMGLQVFQVTTVLMPACLCRCDPLSVAILLKIICFKIHSFPGQHKNKYLQLVKDSQAELQKKTVPD